MYVDVHAHLIHERFAGEEDAVAERAAAAGLEYVIANGLEPRSNRATLALAERHAHVLAALGVYPVDAIAGRLNASSWTAEHAPPRAFDVDEEIDYIDSVAGQLVAIGECGLDAYWVDTEMAEQERVLRRLLEVAVRHDLPVILHTRKAEERTLEVVQEMGVERADFHCFGGRLTLAKRIAAAGYYLSIPANVERSQSFQRLVEVLPLDRLLTETDAPFLGPDRGARNEPANVPRAVAAMARVRGMAHDELAGVIRENFRRLFRR